MSLSITNHPPFVARSMATVRDLLAQAEAGDPLAQQAMTAMPAALDLIVACQEALAELELRQASQRRYYGDINEGELSPFAKSELTARGIRIASCRMALAKAGVIDTIVQEEAA